MVDVTSIFGEAGIQPDSKINQQTKQKNESWDDCVKEMRANGILVKQIVANGEWQRIGTNKKPNGTDGWYAAHDLGDGYKVCTYGDWATSQHHVWRSYAGFSDRDAVTEFNKRLEQHDQAKDPSLRRIVRQRMYEANQQFYNADRGNVEMHPYVKAKGIPAVPGIKIDMGKLLIPIFRLDGEMVGMQQIDTDGAKKFTRSSAPKAGFFFVGTSAEEISADIEKKIIIAEGVASAASIYEAVGTPVVVCWSAHFALPACEALRNVTSAELVLCLDGDPVGRESAKKCAEAIDNCVVRVPEGNEDFNDMSQRLGVSAVRQAILNERFGLRGMRARNFDTQPPEREWMVQNLIEPGKAGIMAGVGGIGKSMEALRLALMISQGEGEWMGNDIVRSGNVVYISAEDDSIELHRRIDKLDPNKKRLSALHDVYFLSVPDMGKPVTLLKEGEDGLAITADADELVKELETIEDLAMVIIDPIQAFVTAPISSSNEAAQLWATWAAGIAARFGCGVMSIHHMSKVALTGAQTATEARAAIRGATALVDGHRWAIALWNASEAEVADTCTLFGLHPPDASRVAKFAMVKANAGEIDRRERTVFRRDAIFEVVENSMRVVAGTDAAKDDAWDVSK